MRIHTIAVGFILAGLLTGALALAQDKPKGARIVGAELTKMYEIPVMADGFNHVSGASFTQVLLRGGVVNAVYANRLGNGGHIEGKWRLVNDTVCLTFPQGFPPTEQCTQIYKLDDGSYQGWGVEDGNVRSSFRVRHPQ